MTTKTPKTMREILEKWGEIDFEGGNQWMTKTKS